MPSVFVEGHFVMIAQGNRLAWPCRLDAAQWPSGLLPIPDVYYSLRYTLFSPRWVFLKLLPFFCFFNIYAVLVAGRHRGYCGDGGGLDFIQEAAIFFFKKNTRATAMCCSGSRMCVQLVSTMRRSVPLFL